MQRKRKPQWSQGVSLLDPEQLVMIPYPYEASAELEAAFHPRSKGRDPVSDLSEHVRSINAVEGIRKIQKKDPAIQCLSSTTREME